MYTYMEYIQKCFFKSSGWNEDGIFPNITSTSQALLQFPIPNGCKLDVSSMATPHSASTFTLSNYHSVNGSLAYLYSSLPLNNTMGTKEISLQEAIAGFRIIEPNFSNHNSSTVINKGSLLYGRMYFPGSALEAMIIKRFSKENQLLIKCINNPNLSRNGTMILYLQKNTPRYSREFIYSTNESLCGFRFLYNLGHSNSGRFHNSLLIPKFDNSVVSLGMEIWYAAATMSPGFSTAVRYSTRSTSTGKPLSMTLTCNPILGQISSTYTVKTSVASTFCSKYDFNFFSYESDLSLGFEIYNYAKGLSAPRTQSEIDHQVPRPSDGPRDSEYDKTIQIDTPSYKSQDKIINPIQNNDNYYRINPTLLSKDLPYTPQHKPLMHRDPHTSVMAAFQNLVKESDFSSVIKFSTSVKEPLMKILWEGKCKDFLVSTGVKLGIDPSNKTPEFNRFGVSFSYAC